MKIQSQPISIRRIEINDAQILWKCAYQNKAFMNDFRILGINNEVQHSNLYDFVIQGTGTQSEIDVQGSGMSIIDGSLLASINDDTEFGSIDILSGTTTHTFTIANSGNADLNLTGSPSIVITGVNSDENPYDFSIQGYGQPTLSLSSVTAHVNEGETLEFDAVLDVSTDFDTLVDFAMSGNVDSSDFAGDILSGQITILNGTTSAAIDIPTVIDSVTEGIENFDLTIGTSTTGIQLGEYLVAVASIDDSLIFLNGFEPISALKLIKLIAIAQDDETHRPYYNESNDTYYFFDVELKANNQINPLLWMQDILAINNPTGDWDNDGIENEKDDDSFGIKQRK